MIPTLAISEGAGMALMWSAVILVLIGLIVIAGFPGSTAKRRGHPSASAITLLGYLGLILLPCWIVAYVWAHTGPDLSKKLASYKGHLFSNDPIPATVPAHLDDEPGRFEVVGVDRETQLDTRLVIDADSRANAQVKAELRGVIVTAVSRV